MNFLEANKLLTNFLGGNSLPIHFATSANIEPLLLYIRAEFAKRGYEADISTLPFGTLGQALAVPKTKEREEILLLLPWDLIPECDWRSGIPLETSDPDILLKQSASIIKLIKKRQSKILFLSSPIPPLYMDSSKCVYLSSVINSMAAELGAEFLDSSCFSLSNYLDSGIPVSGINMGDVAEVIVQKHCESSETLAKVLVTDLDNVLWAGLIAEDGVNEIRCDSEGVGFRHYIYQSFLAKLKASGILIAAVSRNDIDIARVPMKTGKTLLAESDFVEILASYEPKSLHIRRLADTYNLGLDAFVFVDDNPIELAEVKAALPQVKCVQFPEKEGQFTDFLNELSVLFNRTTISSEDRQRTEMYRLRRDALVERKNFEEEGGDLTEYLVNLNMELCIYNCSDYNYERAIQLINKTNQFNLNGRRVTTEEVGEILAAGGSLYTAKLSDRSGNHGEILACLVSSSGVVLSLVLSCRVFQRNIEHAFITWLIRTYKTDIKLSYTETDKNKPMFNFLMHPAFNIESGLGLIDGDKFIAEHEEYLNMFNLKEIGFD